MTGDPTRGPLTKEEQQRLAAAKKLAEKEPLRGWSVATSEIPAGGLQQTRSATPEERAGIASLLDLVALDMLEANYRVVAIAGGAWRLSGKFTAQVVQACVVTAEPVEARLEDAFEVEFWRDLEEPEGGEDKTVLKGADVEPLDGDMIGIGRIVFETLSASLNPYPRKDGAAFDWQDEKAADPEKTNPFSILAKLKDKS